MVRIPNIKIPSVRVGSIGPTSNIGTGGATPAPPTPITYLTQWKIVGNSEVHTDPYLTSWKVSGNSVVDNNTILSCGDLGQDGKYHVKISNGVDIYDIALTEPLRKVNNVADSIEFPSETEGKALVTRKNIFIQKSFYGGYFDSSGTVFFTASISNDIANLSYTDQFTISICNKLETRYYAEMRNANMVAMGTFNRVAIFRNYEIEQTVGAYKAWLSELGALDLICQLATPTTELVDAPQIAVSPTDTYTSANDTPYSAFEHTENNEIWSCGEYNATDGKYHILVQPQGGSIADIALDKPLRKVNYVADTIEFPSDTDGKALVTRNLKSVVDMSTLSWEFSNSTIRMYVAMSDIKNSPDLSIGNLLCPIYPTVSNEDTRRGIFGIAVQISPLAICVYDENYITSDSRSDFLSHVQGISLIYQLATPTTELVDAPQIQEADSYTCVISQGGKAVEWSSFETDSE